MNPLLFKLPVEIWLIVCCLSLLVLFYYIVWLYKRNFEKLHGIYPISELDLQLTPAQLRYLYKLKLDLRILLSALINLDAKGYLLINLQGNKIELIALKDSSNGLSDEEEILFNMLFPTLYNVSTIKVGDKVYKDKKVYTIENGMAQEVMEIFNEMKKCILNKFKNKYTANNYLFFSIGIILTSITIFYSYVDILINTETSFIFIVIVGFGMVLLTYAIKKFFVEHTNFYKNHTKVQNELIGVILIGIFVKGLIFYLIYELNKFDIDSYLRYAFHFIVFDLLFIINSFGYELTKIRTEKGKNLFRKIEGYRMFLETTMQGILKFFNKESYDREGEYRKLLPYSVALDVETEWSDTLVIKLLLLKSHKDPEPKTIIYST